MVLSRADNNSAGLSALCCVAILFCGFGVSAAESSANDFSFRPVNEKSLGLWEGKRPVFVYNHGFMSLERVPADRNRSTYLHPIYGLDGEILTDDFPKDHYHHRGLFWAWPHIKIDGKEYSTWDIKGITQKFERWLARDADATSAVLGVQNGWYVDDKRVMDEKILFRVTHASAAGQFVDVDCTWAPVGSAVTLAGAEGKSYGGLTLRFAPRTNTVITTTQGTSTNDLPMTRLAWADLSAQFSGAPQPSGAAIFIAPDHPAFPPEWLTRHYGVLCVGWPGVEPATFKPGEVIRCRYRVWIHRGVPAQAELQRLQDEFSKIKPTDWLKPVKPL